MSEFEYDPTRADFQDNPFPIFQTLRDAPPVYHNERLRFWALSRHDDVLASSAELTFFYPGRIK